jgi:polyisoprenoid-binding protein YceI
MKNLKKIAMFFAATLIALTLMRCGDDDDVAPTLYKLSGNVTYPDLSGTSASATGAIVYLVKGATAASTNYDLSTTTSSSGAYSFENLDAGNYYMFVNYNTANTNKVGRVEGINFDSGEGHLLEIVDVDLVQNSTLVSAGQATDFVVDTRSTGTWTSDISHSNVDFEFPYDEANGSYTGRFSDFEIEVNFDPANLASGSISASVDLLTINTDSPGGRDPLYNSDGTFWQDVDLSYDLGCIAGTFGIALPTDAARYATFEATGFEAYGDGYKATGNFTFNGSTNQETIFFRLIEGYEALNRQDVLTRYSSFEGKLTFSALADYTIDSSHIGDGDVTIYISYQVNKPV